MPPVTAPTGLHTSSQEEDYFIDSLSSHSQFNPSAASTLTSDSMNSDPMNSDPYGTDDGDYLQIRKISDVSVYSEPPSLLEASYLDTGDASSSFNYRHPSELNISLPNLTSAADSALPNITVASDDPSGEFFPDNDGSLPGPSGLLSACHSNISTSPLQDIPEGIQMELEGVSMDDNTAGLLSYRVSNSPIPSSPSAASVSSSSLSMQDMFDESSSMRELCDMLNESVSVGQADFTMTSMCVYCYFSIVW